jgi:hypothetical protein
VHAGPACAWDHLVAVARSSPRARRPTDKRTELPVPVASSSQQADLIIHDAITGSQAPRYPSTVHRTGKRVASVERIGLWHGESDLPPVDDHIDDHEVTGPAFRDLDSTLITSLSRYNPDFDAEQVSALSVVREVREPLPQ